MKYDLEERTKLFSISILKYLRSLRININNENIIRQVLRSATSIGANYREANGASSRKDFSNKIHICKKEAKETEYWLDLLASTCDIEVNDKLNSLLKESKEFILIFNKIVSSLK